MADVSADVILRAYAHNNGGVQANSQEASQKIRRVPSLTCAFMKNSPCPMVASGKPGTFDNSGDEAQGAEFERTTLHNDTSDFRPGHHGKTGCSQGSALNLNQPLNSPHLWPIPPLQFRLALYFESFPPINHHAKIANLTHHDHLACMHCIALAIRHARDCGQHGKSIHEPGRF